MAMPDTGQDGAPTYSFKPSLLGAMSRFTLDPDALEWQIGGRSGRIPYGRIAAVRLSYRPVTMQSHRFVAEIWSPDGPKIQIASVSWRSMVEQQRLDRAYSAFIAELHRRLAAAGSSAAFSTGLPVPIYWLGLAVFASVVSAMAVLVARQAFALQWSSAAIVAAFFAAFIWQGGGYLHRNRPGPYSPDAIPAKVMPKP
jgi:hypothetical protein